MPSCCDSVSFLAVVLLNSSQVILLDAITWLKIKLGLISHHDVEPDPELTPPGFGTSQKSELDALAHGDATVAVPVEAGQAHQESVTHAADGHSHDVNGHAVNDVAGVASGVDNTKPAFRKRS